MLPLILSFNLKIGFFKYPLPIIYIIVLNRKRHVMGLGIGSKISVISAQFWHRETFFVT